MDVKQKAQRLGMGTGLLLMIMAASLAPKVREMALEIMAWMAQPPLPETAWAAAEEDKQRLEREVARLERRLLRWRPRDAYLVVSTTENHFWLYKNEKLIREGRCSTGSYVYLKGSGGKSWLFQTPRGQFFIQSKIVNPVWHKPDWAFVEEGKPIPPPGSPERYEYGVLGRYALAIGNGYLIHGTLYQRLLGMPVTHGCVRLGDDDLEAVYRTLPVGAPVFIY